MGNEQAALEQYREVLERDSDDYRAYYNRGLVHLARQDYQLALIDYERALASKRTIPQSQQGLIYSDRGLVHLLLGDFPAAIADLTAAMRLDSSNERAYYNRACAYHRSGNYRAAIADFSQAIRHNPQYAEAYFHRGWLRHQIGLDQAAFKDLKAALRYFKAQGKMDAYRQTLASLEQLRGIVSQKDSIAISKKVEMSNNSPLPWHAV
jgi:tetratricopeptide (TPR) repeat protein